MNDPTMHAVVAYPPEQDVRTVRQALLGAGLDCSSDDCVPWDQLAVRLAQSDADLVVVQTAEGSRPDWKTMSEAMTLTTAPMLAVGPGGETSDVDDAREAGVVEFIDEADLQDGLDTAVERLSAAGPRVKKRGMVVTVFSPLPGSGATTVASNLAGAFTKQHPQDAALIEVARGMGDLALLLGVTPDHTVEDVCRRSQSLDTTGLRNSMTSHASGVLVLANAENQLHNDLLEVQAVRRMAVLARAAFAATVFAVDHSTQDEAYEAMRLSDHVLMVVRPDVPAVKRGKWALAQAVANGVLADRVHLVVNRWGQGGSLQKSQIESTLGMSAMEWIPEDVTRINKATNQGMLLHQLSGRGPIRRRLDALAATLGGEPPKTKSRKSA